MNMMTTAAETNAVTMDLANSFGRLLKSYQTIFEVSPDEALTRIRDDNESRPLNRPPDQLSWGDLRCLAEKNPQRFLELWQAVKKAALDELQSGQRAAKAVEMGFHHCWNRAQFLALRAELSDSLQPANGIERQLLDTMAQAQTAFLYWLEQSMKRASLEGVKTERLEEAGCWLAPRLTDAEAVEQAATMADRFNKIFLRTLRAFRDLRRYAAPVVIKKAKQVNVGRQQAIQQHAGC
jgi:hypothetical protein